MGWGTNIRLIFGLGTVQRRDDGVQDSRAGHSGQSGVLCRFASGQACSAALGYVQMLRWWEDVTIVVSLTMAFGRARYDPRSVETRRWAVRGHVCPSPEPQRRHPVVDTGSVGVSEGNGCPECQRPQRVGGRTDELWPFIVLMKRRPMSRSPRIIEATSCSSRIAFHFDIGCDIFSRYPSFLRQAPRYL